MKGYHWSKSKKGESPTLITDGNMLIMVEKDIVGGICHAFYRYVKTNNKYMKDYDKNKEPLYLNYWDVNNLYGWTKPQKLPLCDFKWAENTSPFHENLIENYNKDSDAGYFLEVDVQYPEKFHDLHNDLPFLPERMENEKIEKLVANLHDKKEYFIWTLSEMLDVMLRFWMPCKLVSLVSEGLYLISYLIKP